MCNVILPLWISIMIVSARVFTALSLSFDFPCQGTTFTTTRVRISVFCAVCGGALPKSESRGRSLRTRARPSRSTLRTKRGWIFSLSSKTAACPHHSSQRQARCEMNGLRGVVGDVLHSHSSLLSHSYFFLFSYLVSKTPPPSYRSLLWCTRARWLNQLVVL
jgi:hypothetical protein